MVLTNTGAVSPAVLVTVTFYDQFGALTFVSPTKTLGDGPALTGERVVSFQTPIWGGGVTRVTLKDLGGPVKVGWARISYFNPNPGQDLINGFIIFRQRVEGRPDFEATVPLCSNQDWLFTLPFDNRDAFVTALAVVNPGTKPIKVRVGILGFTGAPMVRSLEPIDLAPRQQSAFTLPERFPVTVDKAGVLVVEADFLGAVGGGLSALGLRFNPEGAFTTVPIMNRPEMYASHPDIP
jgi:hypothetical protein